MKYAEKTEQAEKKDYKSNEEDFVADVKKLFSSLNTEISTRNDKIAENDDFIYGDRLERSIDVPIGHDKTPVNWLRRTVEIHKNMFMGRGFQLISTYDSQDPDTGADEKDTGRIIIENNKQKTYAESRKNLIDSIIRDNGGSDFWATLAENASAVGDAAIKAYYDEDKDKYVLSQIESIENLYVLWSKDDFREVDAYAYVYQVSKTVAIRDYGVSEDVQTSNLGNPLGVSSLTGVTVNQPTSSQQMVTVIEVTGTVPEWTVEDGKCKEVKEGTEKPLNALIVGNEVKRKTSDPKKMPRYYILPNKKKRRRAWGTSDISKAAININATYVETLSDWRTHASKVNFQKYKAYGFPSNSQMPKPKARTVEYLPLEEGQDITRLDQGDSNAQDFKAQMDELKEQFVRETGISRVLFDDPSVTLNSNQALLTSMKPTSDIAEAKKQLWTPIITDIFLDALEVVAMNNKEIEDIVPKDDNWSLKVMWPSIMQKEDPVYQQMLLNRFNAGTMSVQSFLEAQGETKEELDRIKDELSDKTTAAILGHQLPTLAQSVISPPSDKPEVKTNISLRGDLTPNQEANIATQAGFNDGPFPASAGPQGIQGLQAQEEYYNQGFIGPNGQPEFKDEQGNPQPQGQKKAQSGGNTPSPIATQAQNQEGQQPMSQPGSGATSVSAQGAIDQANQQAGQ